MCSLTPLSAPSNVKVGLDYIMKNADNEVRAANGTNLQPQPGINVRAIRCTVL